MDEFLDLSIHTWNIMGVVNMEGKRQTHVLIRQYRSLLVAILETHCQFCRVVNFWNSLGYEQCAIFEAQGQAGGVWLLKSYIF
jgi:L-amino acid N-acyltransferase YncA